MKNLFAKEGLFYRVNDKKKVIEYRKVNSEICIPYNIMTIHLKRLAGAL